MEGFPFHDPGAHAWSPEKQRRRALEAERQRRQLELYDAIIAEEQRRRNMEELERMRRMKRREEQEQRRLEAEGKRQQAAAEARGKKDQAAYEARRRRDLQNLERWRQREAERRGMLGEEQWRPYGTEPSLVNGSDEKISVEPGGVRTPHEDREPAASRHESRRSWPFAFPDIDNIFHGLTHRPLRSMRGGYNDGIPESYRDAPPSTPPPTRSTSESDDDKKEEEASSHFLSVRHPTSTEEKGAGEYHAELDLARMDPLIRPTRPSQTISVDEASDDGLDENKKVVASYAASLHPREGVWIEPNDEYDSWIAQRRREASDRTQRSRRNSV